MPRCARFKLENGIYHIMCRSISEVKLFKGEKDKIKYMNLLKKYKQMYGFKLYAYCIMGNHAHLMMDANGADISKVMHGINLAYAKYFNRKYDRHGHLFQDRFKSKIITDESYMKQASLYIHDNPRDFNQYKKSPEKYRFSSLGVYLGIKKDTFGIVDPDVVLNLFGYDKKTAIENYYRVFLKRNKNEEEMNFQDERTEYRSCRKALLRNLDSKKVIEYVFKGFGLNKVKLHMKYDRQVSSAKAITVTALRKFSGKSDSEIAGIIGDITQARISQLCFEGIKLINNDQKSNDIFKELLMSV